MAAYRRVYDSRHLWLTAKNRDQLRNPTLGNRVWVTFTFTDMLSKLVERLQRYGDLTVFKLADVRRLEFSKFKF